MTSLVGAVLCGGSSRRMGTDKALLEIDGVPMAERVAASWRRQGATRWCSSVATGSRSANSAGRSVPDRFPGGGPVGGLITALHTAADAERTVVCACDLPDLTVEAVHSVVGSNPLVNDVRVADSGRLEPMLATWHRRALPHVEAQFAAGAAALHDVIAASTRFASRSIRPPSAM